MNYREATADPLERICNDHFPVEDAVGEDKVQSLAEAVRSWIRPGQSIHFSFTHNRAHAAAYEIARQFWGTQPDFELIATGILEYGILLIHGGLVKKVVAAFYGDTYPSSSPNPILQTAFASGRVALESWTNLTIPLRFMTAAYRMPYIATRSLVGSTMAEENRDSCRIAENPWQPDEQVALIAPLKPDITIIHAWAADRQGNAILLPPYGENAWGAHAAGKGVLVTTERLVSTNFIRRHSHLVKIPACQVRSVSVVPFGAHPQGMSNQGLPEFEAYGDDQAFRIDFRNATRDREQMDRWIEDWVLGCRSHQDYLNKLGADRLLRLRGQASPSAWVHQLHSLPDAAVKGAPAQTAAETDRTPTATALMAVIVSRIVRERVLEKDHIHVLAGIGLSSLASTLAYYRMKQVDQRSVQLLIETGFYGCAPRPGDPFVFNFANIPTNTMQSNFMDVLNQYAAGNNNRCLGVLATGQVDRFGNLNSTRLADGRSLVGAGGANDIANGAAEVIVMLKQSRFRWLPALPYITCPGNRVTTLVSDMGVFRRPREDGEFVLTACLADSGADSLADRVNRIKEKCGWELKVADTVAVIDPPDAKELKMLRMLDPQRYFTA